MGEHIKPKPQKIGLSYRKQFMPCWVYPVEKYAPPLFFNVQQGKTT